VAVVVASHPGSFVEVEVEVVLTALQRLVLVVLVAFDPDIDHYDYEAPRL
jgi:hypothetical protein